MLFLQPAVRAGRGVSHLRDCSSLPHRLELLSPASMGGGHMSRDKKENPTSSMVNCCVGKVSAGSEGPRTKARRPQAGKPLEPPQHPGMQQQTLEMASAMTCSFEERQPNRITGWPCAAGQASPPAPPAGLHACRRPEAGWSRCPAVSEGGCWQLLRSCTQDQSINTSQQEENAEISEKRFPGLLGGQRT